MQRRLVQCGGHLRGDWRGFPVRGLRAARPTLLHHHARVRQCDGRLPLQWLASVLPEQQLRHAGPSRRRLRPEPWFCARVRGLDPHVRLQRDDVVLHRVRRPRQPLLWHHLRDRRDLHRGDLSGRSHFVRRKQRQWFGRRQRRWRARVEELARCAGIDSARNVVLVGPVGTGKTHLATALGIEAIKRGHHVLFFRASDLVRALTEARDARLLSRLQDRLRRASLLLLDELGFVPFEKAGGELLFDVLSARHERAATVITSNLAFSEWNRVFGDDKLTAALLDRLAQHADVLVTRGPGDRVGHALKRKDPDQEPATLSP
jgi:DNA replication protein DnaC